MDYLALVLLSIGLSLDDFGLALALSLLMPGWSLGKRVLYAGEMAIAFSISSALLPLLGWLIGIAIYEWVVSISAWVILVVFCGIGVWVIKEAFENERFKPIDTPSFWVLLTTGVFGSLDEGAVGISYPFLETPVQWIILAVILVNTVLIHIAVFTGNWLRGLYERLPPILSGIILITLGVLEFLELVL